MLDKILHPQLVDDLAIALIAKFNIKDDPKNVAGFINHFGSTDNNTEFVLSGFPIGKIQSETHFQAIQKDAITKNQWFNVSSGRWMNSGNNTMVYGDGWCAKRNSPEHQAMLKIVSEDEEESIEIDERDGYMVVKGTKYIWCKDKEKIIGRLKNGNPICLTHDTIRLLKKANYPFEKCEETEIVKNKIS